MKTLNLFAKVSLFLLVSIHSIAALSGEQSYQIKCETPRSVKVMEIKPQMVTFYIEGFNERIPASIANVRTRKRGNSITKMITFEGKKHTIHIQDIKKLSDLNDYLIIRSNKGHEVTYPLKCKTANVQNEIAQL